MESNPIIPMTEVESTNIKMAGYQPTTEVLAVEFNHGGTYHFKDVPAKIADTFIRSKSVGRAFHSMIKGKFESTKITSNGAAKS